MEPTTYFTIFVIGVGAFHLACQAADHIGKWLGTSQQTLTYGKRTKQKRDDWYVFFHRSDLTGSSKNKQSIQSTTKKRPSVTSSATRKSTRRPAARVNLS